jgi:hypothetical protein
MKTISMKTIANTKGLWWKAILVFFVLLFLLWLLNMWYVTAHWSTAHGAAKIEAP